MRRIKNYFVYNQDSKEIFQQPFSNSHAEQMNTHLDEYGIDETSALKLVNFWNNRRVMITSQSIYWII